MIKKYTKKPISVEAVQITEENTKDGGNLYFDEQNYEILGVTSNNKKIKVVIHTLEGTMTAREGDYIVKGVEGEIYPVKKEIFEKTYEEEDAYKELKTLEEAIYVYRKMTIEHKDYTPLSIDHEKTGVSVCYFYGDYEKSQVVKEFIENYDKTKAE